MGSDPRASADAYDVFLVPSATDHATVEEIAGRLRDEQGLRVFWDEWDVVPGEVWIEAIERALERSKTIAVFYGKDGLGNWQDAQKQVALDLVVRRRADRIIPVVLPGGREDDVKGIMRVRHPVHYARGDGFARLVAGIKGVAPGGGGPKVASPSGAAPSGAAPVDEGSAPRSTSPGAPVTVFVSYSHDTPTHEQRVLALADELRGSGIDARLDQYVDNPPEGWLRWMERQLVECNFVLLVCTSTYRQRFNREDTGDAGKGAKWEALIAEQLLYEAHAHNERLIPVLFEDGDEEDVPLVLRAYTRYRLPGEYDRLYRRLTGQHGTKAPPLGAFKVMPAAPRSGLGTGVPGAGSTGSAGAKAKVEITDEVLVDELARVLSDADEARLVVKRAGFSPANVPSFRMPIVFWTNMVESARNGMIAGGVKAVADAAAKMYPGNAVFGHYRGR
jgi:SEFIR domain/TIR domain/Effector-associated domain 1